MISRTWFRATGLIAHGGSRVHDGEPSGRRQAARSRRARDDAPAKQRKVTREHDSVTAADVSALLALGVTRSQVEDALNVAFVFNVIDRLADTFEFHIGPDAEFEAGARGLLSRG